jgi:DNA repair protein RecO (recombination protein O)
MNNRQRLYRTHAVVLRRRDYLDADRILTVFTPGMGKLELIAKGIRKITSRKAGHLELFTHVVLLVAQARTWDIVTEAMTVESYRHLRENLENIGRANYVCELVDCFTEASDENQPLWELLVLTLRVLDECNNESGLPDPQVLLRWFELHLLNLTGFQPQLFHCLECSEELQPVTNFLHLAEGGILCPACGRNRADAEPIEADVLKVLRFLQSHGWSDVHKLAVRPHIMRAAENILYRYLLVILEHQLKSTDFLRRLQMTFKRTN